MTHGETPGTTVATERRTTQARQGVVLGRMRYVLGVGLILAVLALAISYAMV